MNLFRKKPAIQEDKGKTVRSLNAIDLTLMGVGCIVGSGIFVLTGVGAATTAGPGIVFSFLIGSITCIFAGLCYAEVSSSIPSAGSVYSYSYVCFGEIIAHLIGWMMFGFYILSAATVISGWSGYFEGFLIGTLNIHLPDIIMRKPMEGGVINLPAIVIAFLMGFLLIRGTTESKIINNIFVLIKLSIILLFLVVGIFYIKTENWHPFLPFGINGVFAGASLVFFAYTGFDVISTSAEETKEPQKNLPIGILSALIISTLLYIAVCLVLTGILNYTKLNQDHAVAYALYFVKQDIVASIISIGALIGLFAGMFAFMYAGSRIIFAMSRDKLLPNSLASMNKKKAPANSILVITILAAFLAGVLNTAKLAYLANIALILAFGIVGLCLLSLRKNYPDINKNSFKVPAAKLVVFLNVIMCIFLLYNLPWFTWVMLFVWLSLGTIIYFTFSVRNNQS